MRKGNPKHIRTWDDLLKPGIQVLTPNPFTSGAAKWNLLAAYGQASDAGKDPQAGLDYVSKLLKDHVKVQDKSGREALQSFVAGNGDVLLSYEYEATTAQKKGEDVDYVVPDDTIKINIDIAPTTTSKSPQTAQAFIDYVLSQARAGAVRRLGLPPGQRRRARRERVEVPRAARPVHDRGPRRLAEGERHAVRPGRTARSRRSRSPRGSRRRNEHAGPHRAGPRRGRARRAAAGARARPRAPPAARGRSRRASWCSGSA